MCVQGSDHLPPRYSFIRFSITVALTPRTSAISYRDALIIRLLPVTGMPAYARMDAMWGSVWMI